MRLTRKKTEDIIKEILGEEGLPLVRELYGKENVSEFDLSSRTKKDIKIIRRMLYNLYNQNVVGFTRKKDKEKGWYIYYWTLLSDNLRFYFYKKKRERQQSLREQLQQEHKELFFVCPVKCVRLNFDQAMDFEFHCPECGKLTVQDSSFERIQAIEKEMQEIGEELKQADNEERLQRRKTRQRRKEVIKKVKGKKKHGKAKRAPAKNRKKR